MTTLVSITRSQKLALKDAPLSEVAETLLGGVPVVEAPTDFPELPAPLEATAATRKSFGTLGKIFNKVIMVTRRRMTEAELADLGAEYEDIKNVSALLENRAEQIKEYVRTHQDVEAEEQGLAFPKDVVRNGNILARATERDAKGHYLLAAPKNPSVTEIPGTNGVKFSNQYSSGRTSEDLAYITRAFEAGEIDEAMYKACTRVVRVPDAKKISEYVVKTGDTSLLSKIVKRGRPSTALYLRGLKKK
jgi:hypothetical protein